MSEESPTAEIDWQPVLIAMYHGAEADRAPGGSNWVYEPRAPMGKMTGLAHEEIQRALTYMEHSGLLRSPNDRRVALSESGIRVAHDISTEERQKAHQDRQVSINKAILVSVALTAISSVLVAWPPTPLEGLPNWAIWLPAGGGMVVGAVLIAVLLYLLLEVFGGSRFGEWLPERWTS